MKTAGETLAWILDSIRHAYDRPSMYGVTKRQLDGVLWTYHSIWAFMVDRDADLRKAEMESLGNSNTDSNYIGASDNPPASDFTSVIQRWQGIDERLGIKLPTEES